MPVDPELKSQIVRLSDEDLLRMVNIDFADYREEAIQYAEAELRARGISYVSNETRKASIPHPSSQTLSPQVQQSNEVIVTDIQMRFWSMVVFMVKWSLASIPAFIILLVIAILVMAALGGIQSLLGPTLRR